MTNFVTSIISSLHIQIQKITLKSDFDRNYFVERLSFIFEDDFDLHASKENIK